MFNMDDVSLTFIEVKNHINIPKRGIRLKHIPTNIEAEYNTSTSVLINYAYAKKLLEREIDKMEEVK